MSRIRHRLRSLVGGRARRRRRRAAGLEIEPRLALAPPTRSRGIWPVRCRGRLGSRLVGTSSSFRAPERPRWSAFIAALVSEAPIERIRSELFNAGSDWQAE